MNTAVLIGNYHWGRHYSSVVVWEKTNERKKYWGSVPSPGKSKRWIDYIFIANKMNPKISSSWGRICPFNAMPHISDLKWHYDNTYNDTTTILIGTLLQYL